MKDNLRQQKHLANIFFGKNVFRTGAVMICCFWSGSYDFLSAAIRQRIYLYYL